MFLLKVPPVRFQVNWWEGICKLLFQEIISKPLFSDLLGHPGGLHPPQACGGGAGGQGLWGLGAGCGTPLRRQTGGGWSSG